MHRSYFAAVTAAILLVACLTPAYAQFEGGSRYDAHSVSVLVDRVHSDLDHAYGVFHFSSGDRDRLNHAEKKLREFARKWTSAPTYGVSRAADHGGGNMPEQFSIESAQMRAISQRLAEMTDWLAQNASYCETAQKHLDDGTAERAYWHYGYLCALRDVVSMISRPLSRIICSGDNSS